MLSPAIVRLTCRRARTSGAIPENSANFCARLVRMTRDLYLRTAAFYLRSGNDSPLCAAGHNGESLPDLNIVMAWMTQHIQRVLDAWHHAGTRRVEGDQLRHIAPELGYNVPKLSVDWILRSPLSYVSVAAVALVHFPRPGQVR